MPWRTREESFVSLRKCIIIKTEKRQGKASRVLNIGDYVRLVGADKASKFNRGFHIQNTEEIFKIASVDYRQSPLGYTLQDLSNQPIQGLFYKEELIKVQLPDVFPIIIKKKSRVVNGRKQFFVSWLGYDPSQDGDLEFTNKKKKKAPPLAFVHKDLVLLLAKLSPDKRKK